MSEADIAGALPLSRFLKVAVVAGVESAVRIHIDRGDDLDARDASGMTPLMLSASRNRPAICRLLLSAGADHGLRDHLGRTALEIAVSTGSNDVVEILGAIQSPTTYPEISNAKAACQAQRVVPTGLPASPDQSPTPEPAPVEPPPNAIVVDDCGELDIEGWEAEEDASPPEDDQIVLGLAGAIQIAITSFEPIDSSTKWDDVEAYLPEQALPLAMADDAEARSRLRLLLLRAIREGSVPMMDVQELSINDDRSTNPTAEAYLTLAVNDLGAEVDERIEYVDTNESFEVFVDPKETPDEESALDQALAAIDSATSPRNEPLRIYQREFQRLRLLTAREEVELAQGMEAALEASLYALAKWPDGIAQTLAAGAEVLSGDRQLSSMWLGDAEPDPELEPVSMPSPDVGASEADLIEEVEDEDGEPTVAVPTDAGTAAFADALHRLRALTECDEAQAATVSEIRLALVELRLSRRFLLALGDTADGASPCIDFGQALAGYRVARNRMTAANLKLSFFHAKKYLYSGEPLDDLTQEANIGLLKAVDRYEWRRGYRFSTYATWWIRQQIGRHIADKARTIRVPVHVYEKTHRLAREVDAFEAAIGREPTVDELAPRMEMPAHKVAALLRIAPHTTPVEDCCIDDMVAIESRESLAPPDPADLVGDTQLRTAIGDLLSSLPSKEERILRLRFGIGVAEAHTLEEIGQIYALTRERIRQIEAKAIRKLKHPARANSFARMALGTQPPRLCTATVAGDLESAVDDEAVDRSSSDEPRRQQSDHLPASSEQGHTARPLKSLSLDRVLAQAADLGIPVEDDRSGSSEHLWVHLVDTSNKSHSRLARRLLKLGFALWPGKGYWR